jgi:hypothetical protein
VFVENCDQQLVLVAALVMEAACGNACRTGENMTSRRILQIAFNQL